MSTQKATEVKTPRKPAAKRAAKKASPAVEVAPTQASLLDEQPKPKRMTAAQKAEASREAFKKELGVMLKEVLSTEDFRKELGVTMKEVFFSEEMQEAMRQSTRNIVASVFKERADKALSFRRASITPSSHPRPEQHPLPKTFNNLRNQSRGRPANDPVVVEQAEVITMPVYKPTTHSRNNQFNFVIDTKRDGKVDIAVGFYDRQEGDTKEKSLAIMESAAVLDNIFVKAIANNDILSTEDAVIVQQELIEATARVFSEEVIHAEGIPKIDVYQQILGGKMPVHVSPEKAAEIEVREKIRSRLQQSRMQVIAGNMNIGN